MVRLCVVEKEKCKPTQCNKECKKYCPIEKKENDSCITIGSPAQGVPSSKGDKSQVLTGKAKIDEATCIGCGICQKRCPLEAIKIVNLPSISAEDLVHRYDQNGFALYNLPTPREGEIVGLLGRNGIGKTTAVKLLSGQEKMNLGKDATDEDIKKHFQGNEILKYLQTLPNKKIAYKPQNLIKLSCDVKVFDLLKKLGDEKRILKLAKRLDLTNLLENKMDKLSGGELQRVAIVAATLSDADIHFFDEPLAYLDIKQRLNVSDYIKEISEKKTTMVVEHDLLILDYLTDSINIMFGSQGAFGCVSSIKASKNAVNAYIQGYLKDENMMIRDKEISFNFTKNAASFGEVVASWPSFVKKFETGFELESPEGEIRRNHCIGILGENGTGKTTFVKILAGEEEVQTDKGRVKLDLKLKVSYKKQYLFSESEEIVRDIIFKEKINNRLKATFNLGVLQNKKLNQLSGGELQRFSIARCLARPADVYLLDEPSAYLDVEERISCAKAIKDHIVETEKTAFIVDHDLLLISYVADSILNFDGEPGIKGKAHEIKDFKEGVSDLLKSLDITLRKDSESGRPRINKKGSVKDREQKEKNKWVVL